MAARLTTSMRLHALTGLLMIMMGVTLAAQNADNGKRILAVSGQVALGQNPVTRMLHIDRDMRTEVEHRGAKARVYLVLRGPVADLPPGIIYNVFLDLPAGEHGHAMNKYLIGSINFYEMRVRSFLSFDITSRLNGPGKADGDFRVTLIPDGNPASDSHIHIDRIELVLLPQGT
jgi:hypothetical protein